MQKGKKLQSYTPFEKYPHLTVGLLGGGRGGGLGLVGEKTHLADFQFVHSGTEFCMKERKVLHPYSRVL